MLSLSQILSDLNSIADNYGLEGTTKDAIVNLLSKAIYDNELCTTNLLLEDSLSRSQQLNSRITSAGDLGYSVFRGHNPKVRLSDLSYAGSKHLSVEKLDPLVNFGGYTLVYANDYEFNPKESSGTEQSTTITNESNTNYAEDRIDCYITKNINTFSQTLSSDNKMIAYFPVPNVSNELTLKLNGVKIPTHEGLFTDKSGDNTFDDNEFRLYVITMSGYGIFVVNKEVNNSKSFKAGDVLELTYLEYLSEEVNLLSLKTIPNFTYNISINYNINPYEPRESDGDVIYANALDNFRNSYTVRANEDIEAIIKDYFIEYILAVNIDKSYFTRMYMTVAAPARESSTLSYTLSLDSSGKSVVTSGNNLLYDGETNTTIDTSGIIINEIPDNGSTPISYELFHLPKSMKSGDFKITFTDLDGNSNSANLTKVSDSITNFDISTVGLSGIINNITTGPDDQLGLYVILYKPYTESSKVYYDNIPCSTDTNQVYLRITYYTQNIDESTGLITYNGPFTAQPLLIPKGTSYIFNGSFGPLNYAINAPLDKLPTVTFDRGHVSSGGHNPSNFTITNGDSLYTASIDSYSGNVSIQAITTNTIKLRLYQEFPEGTFDVSFMVEDLYVTYTIKPQSGDSFSSGNKILYYDMNYYEGNDLNLKVGHFSSERKSYKSDGSWDGSYIVKSIGNNQIKIKLNSNVTIWLLGITDYNDITVSECSNYIVNPDSNNPKYNGIYGYITTSGLLVDDLDYEYKLLNTLFINCYYKLDPTKSRIPDTLNDAISNGAGSSRSFEGFYNLVRYSYYVGTIYFNFRCINTRDPSIGSYNAVTDPKLNININYSYKYDAGDISNLVNAVLDEYENKIGEEINVYLLLADLQTVNGVIFVSCDELEYSKIYLENNQYYKFDRSLINYSVVKYTNNRNKLSSYNL